MRVRETLNLEMAVSNLNFSYFFFFSELPCVVLSLVFEKRSFASAPGVLTNCCFMVSIEYKIFSLHLRFFQNLNTKVLQSLKLPTQ